MAATNRLTDLAIANVKAAKKAMLVKVKGGWEVELCSEKKCRALEDKNGQEVVYPAKNAATRALERHNPKIEIMVKAQL